MSGVLRAVWAFLRPALIPVVSYVLKAALEWIQAVGAKYREKRGGKRPPPVG